MLLTPPLEFSFVHFCDFYWVPLYGNTSFISRLFSSRPFFKLECQSPRPLRGEPGVFSQSLTTLPLSCSLSTYQLGKIWFSEARSKSRHCPICHVFAILIALQNHWLRASSAANMWIPSQSSGVIFRCHSTMELYHPKASKKNKAWRVGKVSATLGIYVFAFINAFLAFETAYSHLYVYTHKYWNHSVCGFENMFACRSHEFLDCPYAQAVHINSLVAWTGQSTLIL